MLFRNSKMRHLKEKNPFYNEKAFLFSSKTLHQTEKKGVLNKVPFVFTFI